MGRRKRGYMEEERKEGIGSRKGGNSAEERRE